MEAISGTLEHFTLRSTQVDQQRDGFALERDDELVDLGMSHSLYE